MPALSHRCWLILLLLLAGPAAAQWGGASSPQPADLVKIKLLDNATQIAPGASFDLLLQFEVADGWHIYDPTDISAPTKVELELPEGLTAGEAKWPPYKEKQLSPHISTREHRGTFGVLIPVKVDAALPGDGPIKVGAKVTYGVCKEVCLPPYTQPVSVEIPRSQTVPEATQQLFAAAAKASGATLAAAAPTTPAPTTAADAAPAAPVADDEPPQPGKLVQMQLLSNATTLDPGETFELLLVFDIAKPWHIYDPKEAYGLDTQIKLTLPEGLVAGEARWPMYKRLSVDPDPEFDSLVHEGRTAVLIPVKVERTPSKLPATASLTTTIGVCDDSICLPPYTKTLNVTLGGRVPVATVQQFATAELVLTEKPGTVQKINTVAGDPSTQPTVTAAAPPTTANDQPAAPATQPAAAPPPNLTPLTGIDATAPPAEAGAGQIVLMLLTAALAGLLLNLMPCVLPVISIKVLSFVQQANEDRGRVLALTGAFVAGIMVIFLGFGIAVALGREVFDYGVNQSSLFQFPAFLLGASVVVLLMALWLLGVFEIQAPGFASKAAAGEEREGLAGAFGKGVLATLLGIPCTGPFMGGALVFAATQPSVVTIGIWAAMGLGMASPYILLGINPKWMKFVPKPGAWMITFKQAMGFVLLGTVIWLLYGLGLKGPALAGAIVLLAFGIAAWMWGALVGYDAPRSRKLMVLSNALAIVIAAGFAASFFWDTEDPTAKAYSEGFEAGQIAAESALADGSAPTEQDALDDAEEWIRWTPQTANAYDSRLRLVDFTADWCAICKTNKATALDTNAVVDALADVGGVRLLADWTHQPPPMTAEMERIAGKGVSVPVTAIYPAGSDTPIVFTGPITRGQIVEAIEQAAADKQPMAQR